ncbi:glutamate receptor 2.7-like [Ananas comosus]|uniref:Glutamate receptor n=1 Tax=Ananas comosus TaxID=4615 RepID=A0A6P5EIX2_ANACO|nr:glutamate receptor 2.7-like [Ananas comosus]
MKRIPISPALLLLLLLSLLLLSLVTWSQSAVVHAGDRSRRGESATSRVVDVGVILDAKTWIGNVSWTCMQIALEDFDKAHTGYGTRLSLHLRDSGGDVVTTAAAAVDLMKNVRVQAIIGPQTSTEAKFIVELGNRTQVPIISFSAKSTSLSSQQTPYFIRTAWNDSTQAKVIASIVQTFGWREVVPVYEDTDYGNAMIPYLIDALQDVGAHMLHRCKIPLEATDQEIIATLLNLKYNWTRVFVVHMSYNLAFKFFKKAKDLGMMEYSYVWMTTYGLTDIVDLMGPPAAEVMQGVLGIKPYVRETDKLRDFRVRWRKRYWQENLNSSITEPTVFGLWAYDTVWALAIAVHNARITSSSFRNSDTSSSSTDLTRIGQSQTGERLREKMSEVNFSGMAGKFRLIEGQLQSGAFEIVNVVGKGKRRVGFWTSVHGVSRYIDRKGDLRVLVWPGGKTDAPKGWQWPTNRTLKIGVPAKRGFAEFVRQDPDGVFRGYCIDVFKAALHELPYNVSVTYVLYGDGHGNMNGTYDELVYQVYLKNFDAVVGDITIIANRSLYVDFTLPYSESGVSMVVPIKDQRRKDAWTFLKPLTANLWLATGAFFVYTGFVVWFIEHRSNEEFRGRPAQQLGSVFYFSFSTLVFAHRERIVNNSSRFVMIIWVFVVLILQQSYTASLTSILTVQQLQPTVTDLDQLIRSGSYIGYLNASFMPGLLSRLNVDQSKLIAYDSPAEYNEGLSNGSVAAIIDEIPYLRVFLSNYSNNYTMIGPIAKVDGFGFAFPIGSPLVPDLNRAILTVTESKKMTEFENTLYGNRTCSDNEDSTATSSSSLTFNSFWGLFLITGASSVSALILSIIFFALQHRCILRDRYLEKSFLQRLALFLKLYYEFETSSQNRQKEEEPTVPQLLGANNMASPRVDNRPESPLSFSNHTQRQFDSDSDLGTLTGGESEAEAEAEAEAEVDTEGGDTPGREITSQVPDPPSFADMLSESDR